MRPVQATWDGADYKFVLDPRFKRLADKQYVTGELYTLAIEEQRSMASHRHFMAAVNDAWKNLPHEYDGKYPSPEHLRKAMLVATGFCHEIYEVYDSERDAERAAKSARRTNGFAIIRRNRRVVRIWIAKSQSVSEMKAEEFKRSKEAVLDRLSSMIGVTRTELNKQAGKDA